MGYLWTKYLKLRFLGLVPLVTRSVEKVALKILNLYFAKCAKRRSFVAADGICYFPPLSTSYTIGSSAEKTFWLYQDR